MERGSYEIFAIRYGHLARRSTENFIGGDIHDVEMPLDYFVWVIRGEEGSYVVDTGFSDETAKKRSRHIVTPVRQGLAAAGVDPDSVRDVILTHLHYDHAGNTPLFPNATYHVQEREMAFCTGAHMCTHDHAHHYEAHDVGQMVRSLFEGRVAFHSGDSELAPGISLHHVGGHTDGLQVVRVRTARGWVVLASDATHFFANLETGRPFPAVFDLEAMQRGFRRLRSLTSSDDHVIPGHDPEVLKRYPELRAGTEGWIVRVDRPPLGREP
ncbi:N-acyl homoserine lactonase family protein [Aquibium sp. LZ166]|uniref:N-acyl homoserine lactonase family protein n=1 Tax=Aquibium pacificus TaxID=3153579 RepID=A0ABV3STQ0_9HYPH